MMPAKKISEQDKLEAENLIEEISEILSPCIKCGMCKSLCPVFKTIREEAYSPRGKSIILSEKILDKIVFECNLCKACEVSCPLNLKVCDAIRKAREALVLKGKELKSNKEMMDNVKKTGSPFGNINFDEEPDRLYCC